MTTLVRRTLNSLRESSLHLVAMTSVEHGGVRLPPRPLRFCGPEFRDDRFYLESGLLEVERLTEHCGLQSDAAVLDVGCGPGRLAIGLQRALPNLRSYLGVDVHGPSIRWCKRFLAGKSNFRFLKLDMHNERYSPAGQRRDPVGIPRSECPAGSWDVVNLFSVFSHLERGDIEFYLREIGELLSPNGRVFLTAFLAPDAVEPVVENPDTAGREWSGPLHCVQLSRHWFDDQVRRAGFEATLGPLHSEVDGQTAVYLHKADSLATLDTSGTLPRKQT